MSPEPVTAERAYQSLKQGILTVAHKPGAILNLQSLAAEYGVSVTPVRDAIHRMVGERILELHPGGGFQVPLPTPAWLTDLYTWHDLLIRQALRRPLSAKAVSTLPRAKPTDEQPDRLAQSVSTFFAVVAESSGNLEIAHAVASAAERLYVARLLEPTFIKGMAAEIEGIIATALSGSPAATRNAVWEYHRRRRRRAEKIAAALQPQNAYLTS